MPTETHVLQFELLCFLGFLIKQFAKNLKLQSDKFGTQKTIDLLLKKTKQAGIHYSALLKNKSLKLGFSNHLPIVESLIKIFYAVYRYFKQIILERKLYGLR